MNATLAALGAAPQPREIERAGRALAALTRTLHELNLLLPQYPAPAVKEDRLPDDPDEFLIQLAGRMDAYAARRMAEQAQDEEARRRFNPPA
jgi:hypothetical protein